MKWDKEIFKQYSFKEKISFLLYKILKNLINRIPSTIPASYFFFNEAMSAGCRLQRMGNKNLVHYNENGTALKAFLRRNTSDFNIFKDVFLQSGYAELVTIARQKNLEVQHVIDAGANIGLASIYLKAYFPAAQVVCLEPSSENAQILQENIKANSLNDVHVEEKGLWGNSCLLKVRDSFRDNEPWSFSLEETADKQLAVLEAISIPELIQKYGWNEIDILKIDIEGGETSLFDRKNNPDHWLRKVKIIAIEIHDEFDCRKHIEALLRENKFTFYQLGELTFCINENLV